MSRVDYSKWDHIELSDDEDIECHPNVDKKSFVRWRQQQIHEERGQRKQGIEQYGKQLDWLDQYLTLLERFPDPHKDTIDQAHKLLSEFQNVPDNLQFTRVPNTPEAFSKFRDHVRTHRQTIIKERDRLVSESNRKLALDDLCTPGFESTRISKSSSTPTTKPTTASSTKSKSSSTTTQQVVEVLNSDGVAKGKLQHAQDAAKTTRGPEDTYINSEETLIFANWSNSDYEGMYKFLRDHPHLVSSTISDEILAAAFQAEMDGKNNKTKKYVHQAQVIQFCVNLGQQGAPMFFSKISDPNHQATQLFKADIDRTLTHIQKRCSVLRAKAAGELKSAINLEPGEERMSVFRELPPDVQQALISEDLNQVDLVLASKPERERESLRSRMLNAGILREPNSMGPDPLPAITDENGIQISGEQRLNLFKRLPSSFGQALTDGDLDKAQQFLSNLPSEEQERVLDICKQGGFLEFEEVEEEGDNVEPSKDSVQEDT